MSIAAMERRGPSSFLTKQGSTFQPNSAPAAEASAEAIRVISTYVLQEIPSISYNMICWNVFCRLRLCDHILQDGYIQHIQRHLLLGPFSVLMSVCNGRAGTIDEPTESSFAEEGVSSEETAKERWNVDIAVLRRHLERKAADVSDVIGIFPLLPVGACLTRKKYTTRCR